MTFTPPPSLGSFTFPAPYGTQGIRLTNASNAPHGLEPRMYSYWCAINAHRGRADLYVFLERTGLNPFVLKVKKATGQVSLLREMPWAGITSGEGSYFSDTDPARLYYLDGPSLQREDVETGRVDTVFALDAQYGDNIWQAHSSADGQVHSATVRRRTEGSYPKLGTVVFRQGRQRFIRATGDLDESHLEKGGRRLAIEQDNDLLVYNLDDPGASPRRILDRDGAPAHCDVGDDLILGEDNWHEAGALVAWDLADPHSQRRLVIATGGSSLGHVAVRGGRALLSSNATAELIDVPLSGSDQPRLIAPGMIDGGDYDHQLRACLDPSGEYACWIAQVEGRLDAFLVRMPGAPQPPIVVVPPDPKPGGHTVPGSQPYPSEADGGWWSQFESKVADTYAEAGQPFPDSAAAFRWHGRTAYDIGAGMNPEQAKAKHLRELREALGLGGSTANPQ